MVRRIFSLNFLDAYIFGIATVALPLLMLERGIDLVTIGVIFSVAPMAKLLVRLLSAAAADAVGERVFYTLNAASNLAQSLCFWLWQTPAGFAAGKAADGARESFIWAVNRSSIMSAAPEKGHFTLGSMVGGRNVYLALGSLTVALLYSFGGFDLLFALCAAIALVMLALSFAVKSTPHRAAVKLSDLTMLGRAQSFYETAGAMLVGGTLYSIIIFILIPVFFKLAGFSLIDISLLYAAYFLVFGAALWIISHIRHPTPKSAIWGAAIFTISLAGMAIGGPQAAPAFFLLMALGDAQLALLWEELIYREVKKSRTRSTDIALLHVPTAVAAFLLSGPLSFAAEKAGFAPVFLLGAASFIAYAAWCIRLSKIAR